MPSTILLTMTGTLANALIELARDLQRQVVDAGVAASVADSTCGGIGFDEAKGIFPSHSYNALVDTDETGLNCGPSCFCGADETAPVITQVSPAAGGLAAAGSTVATDVAGNPGTGSVILQYDGTPPALASSVPADGAWLAVAPDVVHVELTEPVKGLTVNGFPIPILFPTAAFDLPVPVFDLDVPEGLRLGRLRDRDSIGFFGLVQLDDANQSVDLELWMDTGE